MNNIIGLKNSITKIGEVWRVEKGGQIIGYEQERDNAIILLLESITGKTFSLYPAGGEHVDGDVREG